MTNTASLADRYGSLKAEIDALSEQLKDVSAQIKETGLERIQGALYTVTVGLSERSTIDREGVSLLLSPEQLASVTKVTLVTTLRVKGSARIAA